MRVSMGLARFELLLVLGLTALMAGCGKVDVPVKPIEKVKIVEVSGESAGSMRDFPAVIQATDLSTLSFRVNGELVALPAISGVRVQQGDLLAKLDPADFQRRVNETDASYKLAKLNFERAAELIKTGAISPSEHDKLEAEFKIAEAELGIAKLELGFTELRAPRDGVVGSVIADNFENVRVGQPVLTIHAVDTLEVVVDVAEYLLAAARRDMRDHLRHQVKVEGIEGTFEAQNYEIQTEKDEKTKSYKATLRMPRPEGVAILPGMSAVVTVDMGDISTDAFTGITLPSSAVLFAPAKSLLGENTFVWKLAPDGSTVTKQSVRVRQLAQTGVEVVSGVQPGDNVLVYGHQQLFEGAPVEVVSGREIGG